MGWCEKCEADCHPCGCVDDEIAALRAERDALRQKCIWLEGVEEEAAQLRGLVGEIVTQAMDGAPVHELPNRLVYAEMSLDLARRVREEADKQRKGER